MDKLKARLIEAVRFTGRAIIVVAVGKLGLTVLNYALIVASIKFLQITGAVG